MRAKVSLILSLPMRAYAKGKALGGVHHRGVHEIQKEHRCCDALFVFGAPSGIRTRDPLIKSQLLYQLS